MSLPPYHLCTTVPHVVDVLVDHDTSLRTSTPLDSNAISFRQPKDTRYSKSGSNRYECTLDSAYAQHVTGPHSHLTRFDIIGKIIDRHVGGFQLKKVGIVRVVAIHYMHG